MMLVARGLVLAALALSVAVQAYSPRELDRLPMLTTDAAAVAEQIARHGEEPRRFAVSLPVAADATLGPDEGLRLFSAGAAGVAFSARNLVPGARLRWSTPDESVVHLLQADDEGELWAPPVPGEIGVLSGMDDVPLSLSISAIHHRYRAATGAKAAGDSGSCNIDVICPAGDDWRDEIRSTVLLFVNNQFACTGTLVNNTANDNDPLILTANHCQITPSNVRTVIATFNFQRPSCGGFQNGPSNQTVSGAEFIASAVEADTTLIRLSSAPPSRFNVYYAGWDARGSAAPQSGVAIHHPAADNKKISVYNTPATAQDDVRIDTFTADTWRVQWSQGTTEQGSSGGGLWNQDRAVVGVLSGGSASCGNLEGPDFYGRLDRAWDTSSALRQALDPVNGGTLRTRCGRDPQDLGCPGDPTPTPSQTPSPSPTPSPSSTPTASPTPSPTPSPSPSLTPSPTAAPTATPPPATSNGGGGALSPGLLVLLMMLVPAAAARGRRAGAAGR